MSGLGLRQLSLSPQLIGCLSWDTIQVRISAWLITCLHSLLSHLVWSIGEHGPTQQLVDRLRPMLIKYEATAYFCGHDHSMQHIREENSTLDYFVIGAGHMSDHSEAHKVKAPLTHQTTPTSPKSCLLPHPSPLFYIFCRTLSQRDLSSIGMLP